MDILWNPWRYEYIKSGEQTASAVENVCVFCNLIKNPANDEENFILYRAGFNFVILNIYPYISGHLMIIPYEHIAELDRTAQETTDEMMNLTKKCQTALREVYHPHGFNIGINQGKAGGAGVAEHLHQHILPRWIGDANFMTTIGETRTIPEELRTTFDKLKPYF